MMFQTSAKAASDGPQQISADRYARGLLPALISAVRMVQRLSAHARDAKIARIETKMQSPRHGPGRR